MSDEKGNLTVQFNGGLVLLTPNEYANLEWYKKRKIDYELAVCEFQEWIRARNKYGWDGMRGDIETIIGAVYTEWWDCLKEHNIDPWMEETPPYPEEEEDG